jgi:carbamoyl-phosphate synthase large subunit
MRKRVLVVNGESQITTTLENSRLENLFTDIINSLNLCGHVILQAIIDNKDQINVIECNPRFGGASTLSINSGLDSFYWAYLESIGINLIDYPFIKAVVPLTQIRFLEDKYI